MGLDPYFDDVASGKVARSKGPMVAAWVVVFCANLPIPLFFSLFFIRKAGMGGMVVAILMMLTLGAFAVSWSRRVGLAVVIGGWIVAALQFMPYLQILAGMFSVSVALGEGKKIPSDLEDELVGFVATILTGGILITVALVLGTAVLLVRAAFTLWRGHQHTKPMAYDVLN